VQGSNITATIRRTWDAKSVDEAEAQYIADINSFIKIVAADLGDKLDFIKQLNDKANVKFEDIKLPKHLIKANDSGLNINGLPVPVDCRVISEDSYQKLIKAASINETIAPTVERQKITLFKIGQKVRVDGYLCIYEIKDINSDGTYVLLSGAGQLGRVIESSMRHA